MLNSAALAALALLVANPTYVTDTGFLLSFLAIGAIAGLAMPLIQRNVQPILYALENWRDVTRDASHPAAMAQFRLDFRDAIFAATSRMGSRAAKWMQDCWSEERAGGLSRRRIVCAFVCAAALHVAADGARFSPHFVIGAGGEFVCCAADGRDCAFGVLQFERGGHSASCCNCDSAPVDLVGAVAAANRFFAGGDSVWELPDTRAAGVGDGLLFLWLRARWFVCEWSKGRRDGRCKLCLR